MFLMEQVNKFGLIRAKHIDIVVDYICRQVDIFQSPSLIFSFEIFVTF